MMSNDGADPGSTRPLDEALWRSVERSLTDVVLPAVDDAFARSTVLQLISLARYGATRGIDPTGSRVSEIRALLRGYGVVLNGADAAAVYAAASAFLTGPTDDNAVVARRLRVRSLLLDHLADDLAANSVLMKGFHGRLPDA